MKLVGAMALSIALFLGPAWADEPAGVWRMDNGKITVEVSHCGESLCAKIIGLKKPMKDGKPKVDKDNPDPALRSRPIMGLSLLKDMKATGENTWTGEVYVPDDGNTYNATMTLEGDTFKLRGCIASILCKTKKFERIE
jgi:uncharacterized protein (DUF2147 family)